VAVEAHQRAVRLLVQGIKGEPAPGQWQRLARLPLGLVPGDERLQGAGHLLAQLLALEKLPLVKGGAVRQVETSQECFVVEGNGLG
jgi:hypothetical protein